jgi:hypothetical protein
VQTLHPDGQFVHATRPGNPKTRHIDSQFPAQEVNYRSEKGKNMFARKSIGLLIVSVVMFGCSKSMNPISSSSNPGNVTMSIAFSNTGSQVGLMKASASGAVDSIRIDSAIVVLSRIHFESNIDTVTVDTSSDDPTFNIDSYDSSVTLKGPFVIHVRDTVAINFANQTLPAGTYTGIKFNVFRLGFGERFHDSDHFGRDTSASVVPDSSIANYSIVVWGSVYKDSAWVPFEFKDNQNLQFKVKGTFTISSPTSAINIALNFNMGAWFTNPYNGAMIDPTNTSWTNQMMIMQAIRASFQDGRCGDRDEMHRWGF